MRKSERGVREKQTRGKERHETEAETERETDTDTETETETERQRQRQRQRQKQRQRQRGDRESRETKADREVFNLHRRKKFWIGRSLIQNEVRVGLLWDKKRGKS